MGNLTESTVLNDWEVGDKHLNMLSTNKIMLVCESNFEQSFNINRLEKEAR